MSDSIVNQAILFAAIGTSLMAGIYFTFSVVIMASLKKLPDEAAIASMNSINQVIVKSWFMPLFFGSSVLALLLIFFNKEGELYVLIMSASMIYLLGMLGCTAFFNVPLNNKLASSILEDRSQVWQHYLIHWTRWNHLRTVCSLIASILYMLALK